MCVRKNLVTSWLILTWGMVFASFLDGNWQMLVMGAVGGVSGYYRVRLPKRSPARLGDYLNSHPILKWFTILYLLIMAGLSLRYMGELSEILMSVNLALLVLILFFPFFVLWLKQDFTLYVNNRHRP